MAVIDPARPWSRDGTGQMKLKGIRIPGFRTGKAGRVERSTKRLDVSARLRQKASKRVRPIRRTTPK